MWKELVFLAIFAVSGPAVGQVFSASKLPPPVVKVGALLSFTGGLEQWCGYIRQGIELAEAEDSPVQVEVFFEDDRSIEKKVIASAAQKLLQTNGVDVLYTWTASAIPVLASIASATKTPLLAGAYNHQVARGGSYAFGAFINYDLVARDAARFLVQKKGARRLGLVLAADDWSEGFEKPFRDEAKRLGAELVFDETVSIDETDLRGVVLRLEKAQADGVLAPLYSSSLYAFLKQCRELRFAGSIHVGDSMFEEDLKMAGPSAEGVYASQIWLESDKLAAALKARFGSSTNALQLGLVASGYDWVKHLQGVGTEIVKQGKTISRETVTETLKTYRSEGYLGEQMYGAPPAQSGEEVMVVKDGKYVRAE